MRRRRRRKRRAMGDARSRDSDSRQALTGSRRQASSQEEGVARSTSSPLCYRLLLRMIA